MLSDDEDLVPLSALGTTDCGNAPIAPLKEQLEEEHLRRTLLELQSQLGSLQLERNALASRLAAQEGELQKQLNLVRYHEHQSNFFEKLYMRKYAFRGPEGVFCSCCNQQKPVDHFFNPKVPPRLRRCARCTRRVTQTPTTTRRCVRRSMIC